MRLYLSLSLDVCIYILYSYLFTFNKNVYFIWKTRGNLADDLITFKMRKKKKGSVITYGETGGGGGVR